MAPKTNLKSHTSTKTSKHTKASENQDTLGNQEQSDDSEYIKFDPSNRRHVDLLWEDLYQLYLLDLLKKDEKFYNETKKLENILKSNPGLAGILVLFKKIVPTIQLNDYEPYRLLYDALVEAEYNHNYNNLCIFVRIATTRLNELKALVKTKYDESNKGLGGNVFSIESTNKEKREGAELLIPLFEEIIRNKQDFYTEYKKTIVPKLIENRKVFLKILCTIIDAKKNNKKINEKQKKAFVKKRTEDMERIKERLVRLDNIKIDKQDSPNNNTKQLEEEENKIKNELKDMILKDKKLHKRIYGQFDRRRKKPNESHWIVLPSVRLMVYKPFIENDHWKKLGPWPINERMQECYFETLLVKREINPDLFIKKINELNKKIQENNAGFSCKNAE